MSIKLLMQKLIQPKISVKKSRLYWDRFIFPIGIGPEGHGVFQDLWLKHGFAQQHPATFLYSFNDGWVWMDQFCQLLDALTHGDQQSNSLDRAGGMLSYHAHPVDLGLIVNWIR